MRPPLARALDGRVHLETPVVGVEDEGDGVVVRFRDGTTERADRVILAVPLTAQAEISFQPPLPEHRRRALAEAIYGAVVKEAALFADAGPSRRRISRPTVTSTARPTTRGSSSASPEPERQRARSRSDPWSARSRRHTSSSTGCREWTRGSYLILGPGQLLDWGGRLGEPHGRIHFAGVERAALKSYMEGAVRAGEDVAVEILAARSE